MIYYTILALLIVLLNCEFDPYRQKLDPKEFEKKILDKLSRYNELNKRKLSYGNKKYINPTSILTFSNQYIFEEFSVTIKAQGGDITYVNLLNMYDNTTILWYNMEIKNENEEIVPLDLHANNCSINDYNDIIINTNLEKNFELNIKIKMRHDIRNSMNSETKNFLYQMIWIYIPPNFNNDTTCNYTFTTGSNSIIVGLQDDIFEQLNSNTYFYYGNCPSKSIIDNLRLTPYQVTWNAYNEITMSIIKNPERIYISTQKIYFDGSNFNFTTNELLTSKKENDSLKIDKFYYLNLYNFEEKEAYFKLNLTFSSSPVFWNVTEEDIKNTSTEETVSLVQEILENDTSSKPDYYKIGKWVYENIQYNISYFGKEISISEIIKLKQGVCHHYTLLYNSLLNSIGIETVYVTGYSVKNLNDATKGLHAWTVAKVDGKWIGLDATWGIFSGYLPLCHLFITFNYYYLTYFRYYGGEVNFNEINEVKLVEIVNFHCDIPYLDINRSCKLCKEIDENYPYYDFNTGECISKCSKVTYNNICYDNWNEIDNKHKYVKMKIMNVK
jgi:hypothetical protein